MATPQRDTAKNVARSGTLAAHLAAISAGRRSKWLVVVIWLLVVVAISPFAGKLSSVEKNDAAAWLPQSAESLKVAELEPRFQDGETMLAVVIYHRESGLTPDDHARAEADRVDLAQRFPESRPSPAVSSEDGKALLYTLPLPASETEDDDIVADVDGIRAQLSDRGDGLDVHVTGPAGFTVDMVSVFAGVDSTLLLATAGVVAMLLLLTYRSPFVWLIPLLAVAFAHQVAGGAVYGLAKHAGLPVNGQSGGILPVLVFGAGTDYALLLIARYREELRRHEDKHEAMRMALRQAGPAILASGATVAIGLLCLLAADLNPTRGLGPVGAIGIGAALLAMLTLLPAVLVILGRRLFWPFVPRFGSESHEASSVWSRVGVFVDRRPRLIWAATMLILGALALGLFDLNLNLAQEDQFRTEPDSITGQKRIAASFPAGSAAPTTVIAEAGSSDQVQSAISGTSGVASVQPGGQIDGLQAFSVTLEAEPGSQAAFDAIDRLREQVHAVPHANALVGGPDAINLDVARANARDRVLVMPLVLAVVLVVLGLLLRSIVAPVLLIATVVLSFAASLGVSTLIFDHAFGFGGMDPSTPLLSFVFLVALGIDYNIFLMSRVHEESTAHGTRGGMLKGLAVTGGVITSAGLVLAATFSVLAVLPLVSMTELGFIVAFGVLLDTLIVRSILVPALTLDLGRRMWWPGKLSRQSSPRLQTHAPQPGGEFVAEG